MTNSKSLQRKLEALQRSNQELLKRAVNAEQVMAAFARGEIDAVALGASEAPVLLHAAQEKLRTSQQLLRAIFDGALEPMVLIDRTGKYVDANPAACELHALPHAQLVGRTMYEFAGVEPADDVACRRFRERGELRGTFALKRADGTQRTVEFSWVSGVAVGLDLSVMRDVTARVQAEERSHESHRRLEEAQAIAHVGSWTLDVEPDKKVWMSREGARIFDAPEGVPLTSASFLQMVHAEDRERVGRAARDVLRRCDAVDLEHRIQRADGSVRWVHERGVVECGAHGLPIRIVGTVQDVTDHHLAVEALRTSEEEFRQLAEAMPQIVWIAGPDGQNVYVNRHWMDYTGLSPDESHGQGWLAPFHPDDLPRTSDAWNDARTTGGTYSLECRLRGGDGVYHWWLIRGVPVRDASGAIVKWFGTCTDIDTLKLGEERLRVLHDVTESC